MTTLQVSVLAAHNLVNRDTGMMGDVSDPYVEVKVGGQRERTPHIDNDLDPVWTHGNQFTFEVDARDRTIELEVFNSNTVRQDQSLGRTSLDLQERRPGAWHRLRQRLEAGGEGELEFAVRLGTRQGDTDFWPEQATKATETRSRGGGGRSNRSDRAAPAAAPQPPAPHFEAELAQLAEMGFVDREANMEALLSTDGDVGQAIGILST